MEEIIEEQKLSPLSEAIEKLYKDNEELTVKVKELEINNSKLLMRERCYQSELGKVRATLQKLAQAIDTTPHTNDAAYQQFYEVNNAELQL